MKIRTYPISGNPRFFSDTITGKTVKGWLMCVVETRNFGYHRIKATDGREVIIRK